MKRIYLAAAAVLALGMNASAVSTTNLSSASLSSKDAVSSVEMAKCLGLQEAKLANEISAKKSMKKAAPDPSVMYGTWQISFFNVFKGMDTGTAIIGPSEKDGYINISGMFYGYTIECPVLTFEAKDGTEYVGFRVTNGQELGYINFSDIGRTKIYLEVNEFTGKTDSQGNPLYVEADDIDFVFYPDGIEIPLENSADAELVPFSKGFYTTNTRRFGVAKITGHGFWPYSNFGQAMAFVPIEEFTPSKLEMFTYNDSEWEDAGNATFSKCGWLDSQFEKPLPSYTVPVKVKKGQPSQALLVNPFKTDFLSNVPGFKFTDGYIYLDLSDPDFAIVRPLVYSGLYLGEGYGDLYCSNEGARLVYVEGQDIESAKQLFEIYEYEMPTLDDSNVLTLPNARVSSWCNIDKLDPWTVEVEDKDNPGNYIEVPLDMTTVIELPAAVVASVKGIEVDEADVNAPTRYFNLQGVEISAPAKGEVVIVKKGGKAVKTVF